MHSFLLLKYCSFVLKAKTIIQGDELCPSVSEACPTLPCGQRCLYNFTSYDDLTIIGTHQTPKHR